MARFHEERNPVQWCWYRDSATAADVSGIGEIVIVRLARRQIDGDGVSALCDDWLHKKARGTQVKLVFYREGSFVRGVHVEVRLEYGSPGDRGGMKGGVPSWEQLIAETKRLRYDGCVGLTSKIWFTATGIDVGMAAEKGVEGAGLVPAGEKLFAWVPEEPANIGASEGEASDVLSQEHRD